MKNKKGISLIVLVITIIVIIILAGAVILSLSNNNPIAQATEASYKTSLDAYNSELSMTLSSIYVQNSSFNPNTFYVGSWDGTGTGSGTIKQYIPSMTAVDGPKYIIAQGKLEYIGLDVTEKQFAKSLGITDGLILWLDGADFKNSPQSTTWIDKSGNGNDGTSTNFGFTSTSGSDGAGSVVFDGTNDYIQTKITNSLPDVFSWSIWSLNTGDFSTWRAMVGSPDNRFHFGIQTSNGNVCLQINSDSSYDLGVTGKFDGNWHHYVLTYDKGNYNVFIDGVKVKTGTKGTPVTFDSLRIGVEASSYYWKGKIREVKLYNRVLTDQELVNSYNTQKALWGI